MNRHPLSMKNRWTPFRLALFPAAVAGGVLALAAVDLQAAQAPMSQEALEQDAILIVTGEVVSMTSKTRKSTVERSLGIHRDRVYTIKLKVASVSKGSGVKVDEEIWIEAWQPATRIPPVPGSQGHEGLPGKGDTVTVYAAGKNGKAFAPFVPNGIEIKKETRKTK